MKIQTVRDIMNQKDDQKEAEQQNEVHADAYRNDRSVIRDEEAVV